MIDTSKAFGTSRQTVSPFFQRSGVSYLATLWEVFSFYKRQSFPFIKGVVHQLARLSRKINFIFATKTSYA
jgi:hypothetical protein